MTSAELKTDKHAIHPFRWVGDGHVPKGDGARLLVFRATNYEYFIILIRPESIRSCCSPNGTLHSIESCWINGSLAMSVEIRFDSLRKIINSHFPEYDMQWRT